LLFTLVGPAGAGKNSLMRTALSRVGSLSQLPTATTRPIRPGEAEGREHYYLTVERFKSLIEDGALLEHQIIHGNLYGMLRSTVEQALQSGSFVIADIDILGAMRARELFPANAISIFIQPPSIASLVERMRARGDADAEIAKRLVRVPMELSLAARCDYQIINEDMDRAGERLIALIEAIIANAPPAPGETLLLASRFRYHVAVTVMHEDAQLTSQVGDSLIVPLESDERLPHLAAQRAISARLGVAPESVRVIGGKPDGEFIPPISFTVTQTNGEETIVFAYDARLSARTPPPDGWHWQENVSAAEAEMTTAS
jgi:guanylate kinase